ncbi:MAG: DNA/RNA non-specific endonuclease [Bernardetiaceae bacterium]|nr:DNA/RNA non-specific endonuclease [Bernardetiaceae bacterium]
MYCINKLLPVFFGTITLIFSLSVAQAQETPQDLSALLKAEEADLASLKEEMRQQKNKIEQIKLSKIRQDLHAIGLPKGEFDDEIVEHAAMILAYAEAHEQARWVMHIIPSDVTEGNFGRSNDFRPDPKVSTGSTVQEDYFLVETDAEGKKKYDGFGFDRGHLAPSADFRWSQQALSESYFYSNMSPQRPRFNRESWAELENLFRGYMYRTPNTSLYMVTMPILHDDLPIVTRSINKVTIPEYYAKAVVDVENQRGIAFIMPNRYCHEPLIQWAVSIDSLERLTGLDFFHQLEDDLENKLEAMSDPKAWFDEGEREDIAALDPMQLPRNHFNTAQAKYYVGTNEKVSICGKVVSTKLSSKGNIFLNLDRSFPNQVFTVSIFARDVINFDYDPHKDLKGQTICVRGKVGDFQGTPSMVIHSPKAITIYDDDDNNTEN